MAYCPVGTLFDKMSLGTGRAKQMTKVRTTCGYCGVGCTFDLNVRDGKVVRRSPAPSDAPVNGMATCVKGRYGYDYVHHPDRLTRPLVRANRLDQQELAERTAEGAGGSWSPASPVGRVPAREGVHGLGGGGLGYGPGRGGAHLHEGEGGERR